MELAGQLPRPPPCRGEHDGPEDGALGPHRHPRKDDPRVEALAAADRDRVVGEHAVPAGGLRLGGEVGGEPWVGGGEDDPEAHDQIVHDAVQPGTFGPFRPSRIRGCARHCAGHARSEAVTLMSRHLATLLALVALAAAACGSAAPAASTPVPGGFISVTAAWARPAAAGSDSAAYLTITNGRLSDDTLVGASSPVAGTAEIHETTAEADGTMGMHKLDSLVIPAGQTVVFEEGGHHVMLIGLTQALEAGATFPLTLTFEQTGAVTVTVEVRAS